MDISPLQFMSTVRLSLQHHSSFHCMHAVFLLLIKISMKCEGRYLTLAWYCFKRFECVSVSFLFPYIRSCPSQNRLRLHPGNAIRFELQIVRATHCSFWSELTSVSPSAGHPVSVIVHYQFWRQKPSILLWHKGSIQEQWLWWGQ